MGFFSSLKSKFNSFAHKVMNVVKTVGKKAVNVAGKGFKFVKNNVYTPIDKLHKWVLGNKAAITGIGKNIVEGGIDIGKGAGGLFKSVGELVKTPIIGPALLIGGGLGIGYIALKALK